MAINVHGSIEFKIKFANMLGLIFIQMFQNYKDFFLGVLKWMSMSHNLVCNENDNLSSLFIICKSYVVVQQ